MQCFLGSALVFTMTAAVAFPLQAEDYFLTLGGGYGPTGNQVSLERNVIFQQRVLVEQRPDKPLHEIYFSDGKNQNPDLQFRDSNFEKNCPRARRLMCELLGDPTSMDLLYRNHEIADINGAASTKLIQGRINNLAERVKPGDRVIIYVTGHGNRADMYEAYSWEEGDEVAPEANLFDTSVYFWDHEAVTASEFSRWLNRMPKEVAVVLIMVQCYSGGFAHTIFHQADSDLGLAPHNRCGFFSQVHDRAAAGCTPDVNETNYQEYSSFFWAALAGKSRTGEPIDSADYNGDGVVSFAEAHTYAVLESDTIDIPTRTSEAFLRKFSQSEKIRDPAESADEPPPSTLGRLFGSFAASGEKSADATMQKLSGPLQKLADLARPDQRVVLEKLPSKLKMSAKPTVEIVKLQLAKVTAKAKAATAKLGGATNTYNTLLEKMQSDLRAAWPELASDNGPMMMALTSDRADEFVAFVEKQGSYASLCAARDRTEALSEERQKLMYEEAKLQRLLRTAENVVLAANLPLLAPAETVERYQQLLALEEGTLVPASSPPNPTPSTATAKETQPADGSSADADESKKDAAN